MQALGLDSLVPLSPTFRVKAFPVHQIEEPAQFVELGVVRGAPRVNREVHGTAGDGTPVQPVRLGNEGRCGLQAERFLGTEGARGDRRGALLHPLAAKRRFLVRDAEVRQVMESEELAAQLLPLRLRLRQVGAHRVRLSRSLNEVAVAVPDNCPVECGERKPGVTTARNSGRHANANQPGALQETAPG